MRFDQEFAQSSALMSPFLSVRQKHDREGECRIFGWQRAPYFRTSTFLEFERKRDNPACQKVKN
jgi:hypothetical protein